MKNISASLTPQCLGRSEHSMLDKGAGVGEVPRTSKTNARISAGPGPNHNSCLL